MVHFGRCDTDFAAVAAAVIALVSAETCSLFLRDHDSCYCYDFVDRSVVPARGTLQALDSVAMTDSAWRTHFHLPIYVCIVWGHD